jgi:hypothetical protein
MKWASLRGTRDVAERLEAAYRETGVGFYKPCNYLLEKARANAPLV